VHLKAALTLNNLAVYCKKWVDNGVEA